MALNLADVKECLPAIVQEIVALIGFADTQKLVEHFGGVQFKFSAGNVYFPQLKHILGKEKAEALQRYFSREEVYIPRCEVALRTLRNLQFKADYDYLTMQEKVSGRVAMLQLCPKYQITDRTGWEILSRLAQKTEQQRLF